MTADPGFANLTTACAFVDQLAVSGVRQAVICPGSRSTPIAVSLATHPKLRVWVHIDERAAAFFALGMARKLREPVAILSTSGTAAANILPAVVEAQLSRIPLIVLTADRPPELRDWGAAQTIDQIRLFGEHAKWFADMPVPMIDDALVRHARAVAVRAVQSARADPQGPVHLNFPFREPLLPAGSRPPLHLQPLFEEGRGSDVADNEPSRLVAAGGVLDALASQISRVPRGIIVCGPAQGKDLAPAVTALGAVSGYPILADPLSTLRFGAHDRSRIIDAYDPFLRDTLTADALQPDMVIRVGAIPTSKPLQQFLLARPDRTHAIVDAGAPRDPNHLASTVIHGDPAVTLTAVAERLQGSEITGREEWMHAWTLADRAAKTAISHALSVNDDLFEGRAVAEVATLLPEGATLAVGNSMPIRDVDAFVRGDSRRLRIVSNRGANGIDGVVSTALGAAAVSDEPVVLVVGDLSFLHDLNGMLAAKLFDINATVVVLNNDGGGIFSFLPQAEQLESPVFEALFGTPTGVNIGAAARLFAASYARPGDWHAFRRDLCRALHAPGLSIVELETDRHQNVEQHRIIWAAVAAALHPAAAVGV